MYFQLQHNFFFPIPDVVSCLSTTIISYIRNLVHIIACLYLYLQMDSYLTTLHHFEIGEDFMQYIQRHPTMRREPEDFLLEDFNPEEDEYVITCSAVRV